MINEEWKKYAREWKNKREREREGEREREMKREREIIKGVGVLGEENKPSEHVEFNKCETMRLKGE